MFFHIYLDKNMQLHPRHFGPHLRDKLIAKLIQDVEGTCSGRHRFVVAITAVETIGSGLIHDGTRFVTFPVTYQCVVFRPFKGEILESVVAMANKVPLLRWYPLITQFFVSVPKGKPKQLFGIVENHSSQ